MLNRLIVALSILAIFLSNSSIGCSPREGDSVGSQENAIAIRFVNHYRETGQGRPHITIAACGHDFHMEPEEVKVVECIPGGEAQNVLVRVEFSRLESISGQYITIAAETMVSNGDVVTLTADAKVEINR